MDVMINYVTSEYLCHGENHKGGDCFFLLIVIYSAPQGGISHEWQFVKYYLSLLI